MLAIAWQYLTGSAVAATVTDRTWPEWPPHPDRVFQALVASWGERGAQPDEGEALRWLEGLGPPAVVAPPPEDAPPAASPKVYVPVNDGLKKSLDRVRKERFFPRTLVGDAVCGLVWPAADPGPHREALARVLGGVVRIGHSSSFVRAWLAESLPAPTWVPSERGEPVDLHLRIPEPGRFAALVRDYGDGGPGWRRPRTGDWRAYARSAPAASVGGLLSGTMLVLRRVAGDPLGLGQTLALTAALRSRLLRHAPDAATRALLSGHAANGAPLDVAHAAYAPLPFVGAQWADGHLLGAALVLPAATSPDLEDGVYRALAGALDPDTDALSLALPDDRSVTLVLEDRPAPPLALRPASWARAAACWATVTPLVLDRQPPRTVADRDAFVHDAIARACAHAGLPHPEEIRVLDVSARLGAPHVRAFPPLPSKSGIRRRHVHAWLRFATPVRGPVLLGAGRYRGYGLCTPLHDETRA
jgi:CRISPR-associated protein Csb2